METFLTSRTNAMLYILQKEKWDFCFIQMQCLDFLQHPLWKFIDKSHPAFSEKKYRQVIQSFFQPLDDAIGRLLHSAKKHMGKNLLTIILSDHGFQKHHLRGELNHWLFQNGFLTPQKKSQSGWTRWATTIRKLDVLQLRKHWLPKSQRRAMGSKLRNQSINFERSLAFAVSSFWGYLYLRHNTTASETKYLQEKLFEWFDPQSGQPIVKRVYHRDEIYHGAACERMPI